MKSAYTTALTLNLPPLARRSVTSPDWVEQVLAFHHLYDVPIRAFGDTNRTMKHMTDDRLALRASFQVEEVLELLRKGFGIRASVVLHLPYGNQVLDGSDKGEDVKKLAYGIMQSGVRDGKEVADAGADSIYFWIGFLIEAGYDLRDVFREVHASNMTKLDENGQPIKNENGKVLKGPNFVEPNVPAALGWES